MGDEEKDKITKHAPESLLAAIFDEQRTDPEQPVSESKTEEVKDAVGEIHEEETQGLVMEQQIEEEEKPLVPFRDSLELPDQSFEADAKKEGHEQQNSNKTDGSDSSEIPNNLKKSKGGKSTAVKLLPGRVPSKRSSGAEFINKNKENVGQPISRTYAAMHRAKVKEKWNDTKRRKDTSKEREDRRWTQNDPQGVASSFESGSITLGTGYNEGYDSINSLPNGTRNWYGNYSPAKNGSFDQGGNHHSYQDSSDLNTNVQESQPYAQQNQIGSYGRTYRSAVDHPYPQRLPTLQYTFASQSAPPGMYSHLRRPLADQVDCLPEEDNYLPSTLPNADFLDHAHDLPGSRTVNSRLKQKSASEPYLPGADSEHLSKGKTAGISSHPAVSYKPYTLRDYRRVREIESTSLGGLGPNTDTSEYKERIQKVIKQKEYADMLRTQHASLKKHWQKNPIPAAHETPQAKHGEAKRQAALNYARSVPKPKTFNRREKSTADQQSEDRPVRDMTLTEMLKMRHEKEKNEVDAIRRELASKIRL